LRISSRREAVIVVISLSLTTFVAISFYIRS
jgi:hypothetical protein